jgi:flagellar basal-body rod modification protein FlgD
MTTTNATTPSTATLGASSNSATSGNSGLDQLANNFNSFLTLLTTQLQNQDPLDPLDTNQFTQQLVEFTGVQQQVDMNTNLNTLISLQQTAEATQAMQLVGSSVTLTGSTASLSSTSPATWTLNSPSPANGNVTITNSSGQVVFTGTTSLNAGSQTYSWNGQGANGVTWPAGQYSIAVTGTGANGQAVTVTTQTQGTVSGVDLTQSPPQLIVGGQDYPMSSVTAINGSGSSTLGSSSNMSTLNNNLTSLNSAISNLTSLL